MATLAFFTRDIHLSFCGEINVHADATHFRNDSHWRGDPSGDLGIRSCGWSLISKASSPYQAYQEITLDRGRKLSTRLPDLASYYQDREAVILFDEGFCSLHYRPAARDEAISFLLAAHTAGHGCVITADFTLATEDGAPAPTLAAWKDKGEPAFVNRVRMDMWRAGSPDPAHAYATDNNIAA